MDGHFGGTGQPSTIPSSSSELPPATFLGPGIFSTREVLLTVVNSWEQEESLCI